MGEPLRRKLRAGLLRSAAAMPPALLRPGLTVAGAIARRGSLGRRADENLARAFPERNAAERAHLRNAVFRHGVRQASEWLSLAREDASWVESRVALDASIARLFAAVEEGKGVIVVTAHLGNWELLATRLAHLGYRGAVVGRAHPRDPSAEFLPRMRTRHGVETIFQDDPPRRMLEVLKRGEVLGLLCDLEVKRLDGEFIPFFGHPALTMAGPAALARAAKVPLLPVSCVAEDSRSYRLKVEEPLALDPALDRDAARTDLLTRMNAVFEGWIREHPEQWAWHQHRWRATPETFEAMPLEERRRREIERLGYDPRIENPPE